MIVVNNLRGRKPTIFIGDRVINGCQDFHISEAENVFKTFKVSEASQEAVYRHNFIENTGGGVPIGCFKAHRESEVRAAVAKYGSEEVQLEMASVTDLSQVVNVNLAIYGTDAVREKLLDHPEYYWRPRMEIAKYGSDELRTRLLTDERGSVRMRIAEYGTDEHRQQLINDPYWGVRRMVALHGTVAMRKALVNDDHKGVRLEIAQKGPHSLRVKLANDEDFGVRGLARSFVLGI